MKHILLICTLLISVSCSAQVLQKINSYGYEWKKGQFDSTIVPPRDTLVRLLLADSGALAYKNKGLYLWDGTKYSSLLPNVSNGLTKSINDLQLGNSDNSTTGAFTANRYLPFSGYSLYIKGNGSSGPANLIFSDSQVPTVGNTTTKQWIQVNPLSTGLPFSMGTSSTQVNAGDTANSVFTWGQNLGPGVVPIVAGKPALGYSIESWYQPNAGGGVLQEAHMQYISRAGTQYRPFSYTINTTNNDIDYYNGVSRSYLKLPGTSFVYAYTDVATDSTTSKTQLSNKTGSFTISAASDKSTTISNNYPAGNRNFYLNSTWDFVYLPGMFSSTTYNQFNVTPYPSGDGTLNFGGPANRWNHLDGMYGRFTNGVRIGDYSANQNPAYDLDIIKSDTTGASTTLTLTNASTIQPAGSSGFNISSTSYLAGNGAVQFKTAANYGIGKAAPWTVAGGVIATTTDHPISFWTGATPTEKMRLFNNGNLVVGTSPADNGLAKLQVGGKVTISTVDSVGTQTGGCLFLDYSSKLVKMGPCGSGGGTPTYFINSKLGDTTFRTTGPGLPANTIQWKGLIPGSGMNSVTTDSTIKYNWGGTLAQNTTISGNNYSLSLGASASQLSSLALYSSGAIQLAGGLRYNVTAVGDANYTAVSSDYFIQLAVITANRTLTLPVGTLGNVIEVWSKNTAAFTWTFAGGTVKDAAGNAITTMPNTTVYRLLFDGTNWVKIN